MRGDGSYWLPVRGGRGLGVAFGGLFAEPFVYAVCGLEAADSADDGGDFRHLICDADEVQDSGRGQDDDRTGEDACEYCPVAGDTMNLFFAPLQAELAEGIIYDSFAGVAGEVEGDLVGQIDIVGLVDSDDIVFHYIILPNGNVRYLITLYHTYAFLSITLHNLSYLRSSAV